MRPPRELAGYLSTMQAKSYSTMSSLELEDMSISGKCAHPPLRHAELSLTCTQRIA
jgi:hypothetical protein